MANNGNKKGKTISMSQLNTYLSCPRRYYLQYIKLLQPTFSSPQMEFGKKIHNMISQGVFNSDVEEENYLLKNAEIFLETMPPAPVFETFYEDPKNPGRLYGNVFGHNTVGIFDVHWYNDPLGIDWKTGTYNPKYTDSLEIQAFILGQLYLQNYGVKLEEMHFNFLKTDEIYMAQVLTDPKKEDRIKKKVKKVLYNISEGKYDPKFNKLCDYCDMSVYCAMNL